LSLNEIKDPRANDADDAGKGDVLSQAYFRDKDISEAKDVKEITKGIFFRKMAMHLLPIIIILAGADLAARALFPPKKLMAFMQKELAFYIHQIEEFQKLPTPDVLFLGSSRIRDDLDSKVFATLLSGHRKKKSRIYNLGLNGARMEEVYTIVNSHLPDNPPPYVIIGISGSEVAWPFNFRYAARFLWKMSDFTSYLKRVPHSNFRVKNIENFIESGMCDCSYLFENRDAICNMITENVSIFLGGDKPDEVEQRHRYRIRKHVYSKDGYWPIHQNISNIQVVLNKKDNKIPIRNAFELVKSGFDENSTHLLRLIVPALKEKGCKVAIVETPPSPYLQKLNPILHGPGFRKWMNKISKELDVPFIAVPVTKYNKLYNNKYSDASHLSPEGAKIFARVVFDKLVKIGFFGEAK